MSNPMNIIEFNNTLNNLILPKKYIMFFHNIEGEDFYSGELGSEDRQARNINVINISSNIEKLKDFSTNVFIQDVLKDEETKNLTLNQQIQYAILDSIYNNFIVNINLERVIHDLKSTNDQERDMTLKSLVNNFEEFSFLENLKDETYIDLINSYAMNNYPDYINFMMDKSFKYTLTQKNVLITLLFLSNIFLSLHSSIANLDKNIDIYISELSEEDFLLYINICTPDFQMSMSQEASKENFPQYKIWKKMEIDFYNNIKSKKINIIDFLTNTLNPNLNINKIDNNINLEELF